MRNLTIVGFIYCLCKTNPAGIPFYLQPIPSALRGSFSSCRLYEVGLDEPIGPEVITPVDPETR
ncbi:hypothetical protein SAMN05444167_3093 [Terriglobus roseus]|uniref:Uncharacterized protein n=1 Tax=Terriglobus roseus TaxID=392734 RepID=A0A1G7NCJ1_9BACT|nr:hypothetical protein SAMN05444167_3093 [Terriglobus roseus]